MRLEPPLGLPDRYLSAPTAAVVAQLVRTDLPCQHHARGPLACSRNPAACLYDDDAIWRAVFDHRIATEAPALMTLRIPHTAASLGAGALLSPEAISPRRYLCRQAQATSPRLWAEAALWLGKFAPDSPLLRISLQRALNPSLRAHSFLHDAAQPVHTGRVSSGLAPISSRRCTLFPAASPTPKGSLGLERASELRVWSGPAIDPRQSMVEDFRDAIVNRNSSFVFDSEHSWLLPPILFEMDWLRSLSVHAIGIKTIDGPWEALVKLEHLSISNVKDMATLPQQMGRLIHLRTLALRNLSQLEQVGDVVGRLEALEEIEISGPQKLVGGAHNLRAQLFAPHTWQILVDTHEGFVKRIQLRRTGRPLASVERATKAASESHISTCAV